VNGFTRISAERGGFVEIYLPWSNNVVKGLSSYPEHRFSLTLGKIAIAKMGFQSANKISANLRNVKLQFPRFAPMRQIT
jgi:hypothetical protein